MDSQKKVKLSTATSLCTGPLASLTGASQPMGQESGRARGQEPVVAEGGHSVNASMEGEARALPARSNDALIWSKLLCPWVK